MSAENQTIPLDRPEPWLGGWSVSYEELRGFFVRRVPCWQDAEDLAQQTFERLLRRTRGKPAELSRGFVFRVARNLLIDRARRTAACPYQLNDERELESRAASTVTPVDSLEASERLAAVRATIAALPPRSREVFILNRFEGMSYARIARQLGIAESTVEKHMIRAIAECRAGLERMENGP